jgi:hypothetical protein
MERSQMSMDGQNQYWENDYTIERDPQIQCSHHQISNDNIHRKINTKIHIEFSIAKILLRKHSNAGGINISDLSYSTEPQ